MVEPRFLSWAWKINNHLVEILSSPPWLATTSIPTGGTIGTQEVNMLRQYIKLNMDFLPCSYPRIFPEQINCGTRCYT